MRKVEILSQEFDQTAVVMCLGGSVSRREYISVFVCCNHKDIIAVAGNGKKACTCLCERMPFSLMLISPISS